VIKLGSVTLLVIAGLSVTIIYAADGKKDLGGGDWRNKNWFTSRPSVTPDGTIDWTKVSTWEAFGHYSTALYAALWAYASWDKVGVSLSILFLPRILIIIGKLRSRRVEKPQETAPIGDQHSSPNRHPELRPGKCCVLHPAPVG